MLLTPAQHRAVCAELGRNAALHDRNTVGQSNRRGAVRDDQRRGVFEHAS